MGGIGNIQGAFLGGMLIGVLAAISDRAIAPQCALLAGTAAITFIAALRVFRWR